MSDSAQSGIFEIGDVLNNTYRIEAVLGRGGTSEVYRARSEISNRVVAIKALRHEFSRNEDYLALMTREEDMREIRHDAIVRYYDNQRTDAGLVYLVMDYVEGPGLDAKLKNGGMSADDLLIIAQTVAEGLAAAHKRNIVHRDLSPDNIILRGGDPAEAVIIDFGIAKDSNPGAETIVGNEFAGKYAYAAPEQLSGRTDARSDIFSLGALLLSTFRGKAPDIGNNPMEVIEKKALPLDTAGVPEPLKSLIDRMTAPNPDQRLQSADQVLAMLRGELPAAAPIDDDRTVIAPLPASKAKATPKTAVPEAKEKPSGGGNKLLPILGVLALIGGGAGLYFSGLIGSSGLPFVDPYTLMVERSSAGDVKAIGHAPNDDTRNALAEIVEAQGGLAELELAQGNISQTWGTDVVTVVDHIDELPEWTLSVVGNRIQVEGLTNDRQQHASLLDLLSNGGIPQSLTGLVDIDLGPRILPANQLRPILGDYADCGALNLTNPPEIGYGMGETITVTGHLADVKSRVGLMDAITEIAGDRPVAIEAEVLNPTLCTVEAALPDAPSGGFQIPLGFGDRPDANPSGRYYVGENPVIDVIIPEEIQSGYLYVSVADVSGNVFHLLPNLISPINDVAEIRAGRDGPITLRVAYSLKDMQDSGKLAFLVDDTTLGKSQIIALHAVTEIFPNLRPTTESAGGYAEALKARIGSIRSLDTAILTTIKK